MPALYPSPQAARAALEALWGHPELDALSPYQRVQAALARRQPDRTPFDFWAVPEMIAALERYLGAKNEQEVLRLLGIDCRVVAPDYNGPGRRELPDGTFYSASGSHRRRVSNAFSTYEEYASFPLAQAHSRAEVESWPGWPRSSFWDWSGLPAKIARLNAGPRYHIRYEVGGIFESAWGVYGLERFLVDLLDAPEVPDAILDCYTDLMIANVHALMRHSSGLIDMVYTYDDVAMQNGLLLSPGLWRKHILPRHQRLNAVIKSYDLKIMYHSCGAIYRLIGPLIHEVGIDVLNPLQPRAAGMDMRRIKAEFGSQIAFHGGIDLQWTLPHGTPQDVQAEVAERLSVLGTGGGYICTTAHYIQADVPVENVIALYTSPRQHQTGD